MLKFKENVLICIITAIKVWHLLLTLLQVITILSYKPTHLLFCTYLLISNKVKNTMVTPHRIKPVALTIWLHKNFKLKYLRIYKILLFFHRILKFCAKSNTCFAMGTTVWGSCQIAQQGMDSHSISHFK